MVEPFNNRIENSIHPPIINNELFHDVSDFAWGSVLQTKPAGGTWSETYK